MPRSKESCTKHALCPKLEAALQIISKKWSGLIIHALMEGPQRYKDIAEFIPGISDRMLSERFKELEEAGIVIRHVYPEVPVRIEYELTEKGKQMNGILDEVAKWAERFC
ncbi:winged helix-turn-helix transcriptional regulator [Paenibacillus thalictri]|uniref:Transcriptional regulator n=1 Tax=Paenibacillus thalictri TaxID=2527873 RepID=A0A4Q9DCJ5_9BACL|nr:helix-turn-helix domain-containing protein [Paenibacillus thalictri]TBL68285.1 transcriptional regulator [Paenibacillus thalictri]